MKISQFLLTCTFLLLSLNCLAAKDPVTGKEFLDNGEFHRSVTKIEKSVNATSYFILSAQTHLSANTGASAVINAYTDMRSISKTMPVYLVLYNNGGVPEKDIEWYLKDVYKIPVTSDKNFHLIRNDSLYHFLQYGGPITKMYYVYNTLLTYKNNAKHHFITDAQLPLHSYNVTKTSGTKLNPVNLKLSYMDMFQPINDKEALFLTDIQNALVVFDLQTGNQIHKYKKEKTGTDYYCELIAKTKGECDTARKYVKITNDLNRKSYYIFNFYVGNNRIYLSSGIQVFVRLTEDKNLVDDENKKVVIKKGELFGYGYQTLAVLDNELNALKHYYLPEKIGPDEDIVPSIDFGFMVKDDRMIAPAGSMKDKYPKSHKALLMQLKIGDTICSFEKYLQPEMTKHYRKSLNSNLFDYFCEFNNSILFMSDNDNIIYDSRYAEPVTSLHGDGTDYKKEKIPEYTEQSSDLFVNYMPVAMSTHKDKLYVIYKYQGKYLLEIKDSNYKTLDIINISFMEGLDKFPKDESGENIKLYANKIFVKHIINDEYYITQYNIDAL